MKDSTKVLFSFVLLAIVVFANSCSFEMNKRRYSRGWNIGFSKEYVTVDSKNKSKPINEQNSNQNLSKQDYHVHSFESEQFIDSVINQDITEQAKQSLDSSVNVIQADSNEIIVTQPNEVDDTVQIDKEEEELEKQRIWYTLAIIFLSVFGLVLLIYLPYWFFYLIFGGNTKTFLIVSIIMSVGLLINILTLIKAGLVLMKETDYWIYISNYNALSLLSIVSLGYIIGIVFSVILKRNKSEFKNYDPEKSESTLSKALKTLLWIFGILLLLVLLSGY